MINSNLRCKDNTFSETIKYFCHFFYFSRRFFRCFSLKTQESCCIIHATRNLFRYPPSVLPPRHNPSSQHGEPVEAFQTALLDAHVAKHGIEVKDRHVKGLRHLRRRQRVLGILVEQGQRRELLWQLVAACLANRGEYL